MSHEQVSRWFKGVLLTLLILGAGAIILFFFQPKQEDQRDAPTKTISYLETIEVTPDKTYAYGAFCRVNYVEKTDDFFVNFGGSSPIVPFDPKTDRFRAGGAEGGNGYSYKRYTSDFIFTGEHGTLSNRGGDAATVMADGYFYLLTGGPSGWEINKLDPDTFEVVKSIDVEIDAQHEATNDQMLAFTNGYLIASSLWSSEGTGDVLDQLKTDPTQGSGTHNHVFTTDLEEVDSFILADTPHINGSYVVYVDGIYNYITSTAFFGKLIIMQYDEDWNYLGTITTDEYGQWFQGAVYDPVTKQFYVAYIDLGTIQDGKLDPTSSPNISVGIFNRAWDLLESIPVTTYNRRVDNTATGRPSVILNDGKLYVSYDVETFDDTTHEENKDWQCHVKIYDIDS